MFVHPQFDPVVVHIGAFGIHWYGLMYLIGFLAFIGLGKWQINNRSWHAWTIPMLDDALFFWCIRRYFRWPLRVCAVLPI